MSRVPGAAHRVVVVGGGIAGLAAAHRLATAGEPVEVIVVEGAARIGGKLRVHEVAGVPVDAGAESLLNRRPEAVDLVRAVGLGDELSYPGSTSAAIWSRGAVRAMPPTVMGVPADLRALGRSRIVSARGVARAGLEPVLRRPRVDDLDQVSVGAAVAGRFGGEVLDRLVEPLLGGVYAGHARRLSLQAAAPQIAALVETGSSLHTAARTARRRAQAVEEPVFAGIRGGVGRLGEAVAAASGATIRSGLPVRELARSSDGGWRLVIGSTRDADLLDADAVVLATPAAPTARLLADVAPTAARELRGIDYASMAVVTLAYPKPGTPPTGSGFLVPPIEGRTIKAATHATTKWPWLAEASDAIVVRASIGRYGEEKVLQRDDADLVAAADADLRDAVGLRGPLVDAQVTRWGGALPQYTVGHAGRVERILRTVGEQPRLEVCGAAYHGVGVAACVADGTQAADRVLAALRSPRTMAP